MKSMKNEPYLVLVLLLLVCMTDMYSGQRIDLVKDSCTGPDEIEIMRKELAVLIQVVKEQVIRIDIMEKALTSVKQECCQRKYTYYITIAKKSIFLFCFRYSLYTDIILNIF